MKQSVTLFCLPHAGASASTYLTWKRLLPPSIAVYPIELPGRGKRIYEPLYGSIVEAVADLYENISPELDAGPYAFFGHSMGTILIYELMRLIRQHRHPAPVHAFLSGRVPPFVPDEREWFHAASDEHFLQKILEIGGTNAAVFENQELVAILLPVLRADYGMVERYRHAGDIVRFECDLTILHGRRDPHVNAADVRRWQECAGKGYALHEFEGDHFFVQPCKAEITALIQRALSQA